MLGPGMTCISRFILSFFFSSRRRHTRCLSDWSSDVCSSDLRSEATPKNLAALRESPVLARVAALDLSEQTLNLAGARALADVPCLAGLRSLRSEERRVGKEGRSRWAPERERGTRQSKTVAQR